MSSKGLRTTVSRAPAEYVTRTLKRLLPSLGYIETLNKDQLIALANQKAQLTALIKDDPVRFFQPNKGGQKAFLTWWDHNPVDSTRVLIFPAGNKAGKTTAGAILVGERLIGEALWDRQRRAGVKYITPAVGCCFAEDFESHRDTILPTIRTWWGKWIKNISYTANNCPSELTLVNGSILKFKTYAQGAETAEGKDWDIVWDDEPPDHDIYTAQFRGLVATNGRLLITATLLKEAWIYDEIDKDYAKGFPAEIHDNDWLEPAAKKAFLDSLSDEEREVREIGKPFNLTGLIYRGFKDAHPYVIPPFELPKEWPYFIGVDPHERKPVHVVFFTMTPDDEIIAIGFGLYKGNITQIFTQLDADKVKLGIPRQSPINIVVIDPNSGKRNQLNDTSWGEVFEQQGYSVIYGIDDINIGHAKMYEALRVDPQNNIPRPMLMMTFNCRGKYGPIYQMQRYSWDEWATSKMRSTRDVKEKPKDLHKDFPDIFRYVVMAGLNFKALTKGYEVVEFISPNFKPYGRVQGPRGLY